MLKASEMKIVSGDQLQVVQDEINRLLSKDWTLHGDFKATLAFENSESGYASRLFYVQALVRLQAFEPPAPSPIAVGGPNLFR